MLNRRQFLERTLKGSSLIALSTTVPGFLASTARAAAADKETVLVVVELNGGNDGLNTVIPYADDLYHKYRPTLRYDKQQVVRVDDHLGLNPGMRSFERLLGEGKLAIVQGVGYPNPNRSHFESMDIWQTADPTAKIRTGWLGRGLHAVKFDPGKIPGIFVGTRDLPLALQGPASGIASVHPNKPFDLDLGGQPAQPTGPQFQNVKKPTTAKPEKKGDEKAAEKHRADRRKLIQELTEQAPATGSLLPFVQRSALQTYSTIDRLREVMKDQRDNRQFFGEIGRDNGELSQNLSLVARMIQADFGTRLFYVSIGGFDTHANQFDQHRRLLQQVADAVSNFFTQLDQSKHAERVVLMTFSEFGRRADENGSRGTDHGAGSCLFLAGPSVKGGVIGKHPSLADLGDGDLKYHTDFRQVYATLLDGWLGCNSVPILGEKFEPLALLKKV